MIFRLKTKYVCGIDLHARKMSLCVMDRSGKILLRKEIANRISDLLEQISPWIKDITIGVESTFNWYWLIDSLQELKIPVFLGHALYIKRMSGAKHKTDRVDARMIADLLRTERFPLAYLYPKEMRWVRDLLRRRHHFVRSRASTYTHFQNTCMQNGYIEPMQGEVQRKSTRKSFPIKVTNDENACRVLETDLDYVESLDPLIDSLEKYITEKACKHNRKHYKTLLTTPGCGQITALTILYEVHTVERFKSAQCFSSYCRVVRASNESCGKDYGRSSNDKIGNPYLKWALSEIGTRMIKQSALIGEWHKKQSALHGAGGAHARLRHKLAVAIYQMLKHNETFDEFKFLGINNFREQEDNHVEHWVETSGQVSSSPFLPSSIPPAPALIAKGKKKLEEPGLCKKKSIKLKPGRVSLRTTGNCKVLTKSKSPAR